MATTIIKTQIQFRRDTTENWLLNKNTVPAAGEPCFDITLGTLKIGDGVKTYEELKPIGGEGSVAVSADGKSIVLEDGLFKLAGFDAADVGAQPRKNADGGIEWVVPTTENLEELKSTVEGLQSDVKTLQDIVTPSTEGTQPLLTRVETLEEQMNGEAEGSVDAKIDAKINEFANEISDDGTVNTLKELVDYVANHGGELETLVADITNLQTLVGDEPVGEQITAAIDASGHITKTEAESTFTNKDEVAATVAHVKYEVSSKPTGTLVNYRDKEIRVMCPTNTKWELQNSGENADKTMYYIGFKAYAPVNAVSFKEDLAEAIADDTMYYFEGNDFAGIDKYGRKYSVVWLPAAKYDSETGTWAYYGEKSSTNKYIGWYYSVEWYDADGKKIGSDTIRINLSNEGCHNTIEPYYMSDVVKEVSVNGTLLDVVDGKVNITIEDTLDVKASEEVTIAEDGTLGIGTISVNKIAQAEDEVLVLDGGASV